MGKRGTGVIDRRYTQVSSKGGNQRAREGRQRTMGWHRGGGEARHALEKCSLKVCMAACERSGQARPIASRMPKNSMSGARPGNNWRRRAGCTHGGLSGAILFRNWHAAWNKASGGYAALNSHAREGKVCVQRGNRAPRSLQRHCRRTHDMVAREGGSLGRT